MLTTTATKNKKKQSKYQRLWAKAESLREANEKLEIDIDALAKRIESEIMPVEFSMGKIIYQVVNRQLDFCARKSFTQWQRSELEQWILENAEILESMGLVDNKLENRFAEKMARELDINIDPDHESLSISEQLTDILSNASEEETESHGTNAEDDIAFDEFESVLHELFEEFDDIEHDSGFSESTGGAGGREHNTGQKTSQTRIDNAVFQRLFRQAATALHPDKESDPAKKTEKGVLMSQLLKARKQHDLITILQMHGTYAAIDSPITKSDEKELIEILESYLANQQDQKDRIIGKSAIHHTAYHAFYHPSARKVDAAIKNHLKNLEGQTLSLQIFLDEVKTLKPLKDILAQRYDNAQATYGDEWVFPDDDDWNW